MRYLSLREASRLTGISRMTAWRFAQELLNDPDPEKNNLVTVIQGKNDNDKKIKIAIEPLVKRYGLSNDVSSVASDTEQVKEKAVSGDTATVTAPVTSVHEAELAVTKAYNIKLEEEIKNLREELKALNQIHKVDLSNHKQEIIKKIEELEDKHRKDRGEANFKFFDAMQRSHETIQSISSHLAQSLDTIKQLEAGRREKQQRKKGFITRFTESFK